MHLVPRDRSGSPAACSCSASAASPSMRFIGGASRSILRSCSLTSLSWVDCWSCRPCLYFSQACCRRGVPPGRSPASRCSLPGLPSPCSLPSGSSAVSSEPGSPRDLRPFAAGPDDPQPPKPSSVKTSREVAEPCEGDSNARSEEHTSELQSQFHLVCRLLLEK